MSGNLQTPVGFQTSTVALLSLLTTVVLLWQKEDTLSPDFPDTRRRTALLVSNGVTPEKSISTGLVFAHQRGICGGSDVRKPGRSKEAISIYEKGRTIECSEYWGCVCLRNHFPYCFYCIKKLLESIKNYSFYTIMRLSVLFFREESVKNAVIKGFSPIIVSVTIFLCALFFSVSLFSVLGCLWLSQIIRLSIVLVS